MKLLSWNDIYKLALAKTTPVKPPIVNKAKKPITKSKGVVNLKLPP